MSDSAVISSVVVQVLPRRLAAARRHLEGMSGVEVAASDPAGKLVVVLDTPTDLALADCMEEMGRVDGVLGVNLVFHHHDTTDA